MKGQLTVHPELAKFRVGMRVRMKEDAPYCGRAGTVTRVPNHRHAEWIEVTFDDNAKHPATWHHSYLEIVAETS